MVYYSHACLLTSDQNMGEKIWDRQVCPCVKMYLILLHSQHFVKGVVWNEGMVINIGGCMTLDSKANACSQKP
jgi:hypothetical protein